MKKITVIGDGGWGTALAMLLNTNGMDVWVWGPFETYLNEIRSTRENHKFLSGVNLPEAIHWTANREEAVRDSTLIVIATPSHYFRDVVSSFADLIDPGIPVVSVTKGFDEKTGDLMSVLGEKLLNRKSVSALSGPSHAEEVAKGIPTAVVVAADSVQEAEYFQRAFSNKYFRVYTSADMIGVQLGGAVKNVIAIAVGACDGMGFGDNTKAALITRGLAEMTRLGLAMGADPHTFAGLSGMGDLIVTCESRHSRNRSVGERLGRGEPIEEIRKSMEQVAEGVWNCVPAAQLAKKLDIAMPITQEVYAVIHEHKDIRVAVNDLLGRVPGTERVHKGS